MSARPSVALAVAGSALLGLLGLGSLGDAPPPALRPSSVPVVGTTLVCPELRQEPDQTTRVAAGDPLDPAALVTSSPLAAEAGAPAPGLLLDLGADVDDASLLLRGSGGLQAVQLSRADTGVDRGLAEVRCEPAGGTAWFVGGSTAVGDTSTLVLVNPDAEPASVDVRLSTVDGPVDPRQGQGVAVPPRSRTVVALDALAPGSVVLGLQVTAERGRVTAALRQARGAGGVEWVPSSPAPDTDVLVPGVPAGPGPRAVLLANLGEDDTTVQVRVATADGQFVPPGLDAVSVPAGTAVQADLTGPLAATPAALRVTSSGAPVLAAAVAVDGGPREELAYAGAAAPLAGPALLPEVAVGPGITQQLLLSAPRGNAVVELVPLAVGGGPEPAPRRLDVPAGSTLAVDLTAFLPAGSSGRFALRVQPGEGSSPVLAARLLRVTTPEGPLTSVLPLRGAVGTVLRPPVVRDPGAGS